MGSQRNGSRTFLDLMKEACRLSRLPGFRGGITQILGETDGLGLLSLWDATCVFVDFLIASDDHFNRVDATTPSESGGEDLSPS